jgi:hypothetical protein
MANLSFISYANCRKQKADISSISLYAYIIADNAITIDENYYIQRNVEKSLQAYYATKRDLSIGTAIAVQYDIKRYISNFEINNSIAKRIIDKTMTISYDVQRDLAQYISIVSDFDLKRYVYKHISLSSDTFRKQGYLTKWNFSTKVIQNGSIEIKFDTLAQALKNISWQNGQVVQPKGMRLINAAISIQENTINDNISMDLMFGSMLPKDRISGNILDYYYDFMVKTTSITDKKLSITSTTAWKILTHSLVRYPDFDKNGKIVIYRDTSPSEPHIVTGGGNIGGHTTLNYGVSGGVDDSKREPTAKASVHFKYLANILGLEPVIMFDDFTPSNGCANQSATCIDLISNFFSWSKEIPWHQINVFIRNKKIYALQRGHEINIVDITDIPHTRPVIQQEPIMIYKTMAILLNKDVGYDVNIDFDFEDGDNDDNGNLLYFETGSADNEIIYDIYNRPAMQIINNADGSQEVIKFDYNTNARQINENHTVLKNGKKNDSYNVYHTDLGHRHAITSKSDISGVIENAIANTNNVTGLNNISHSIIITPSVGEHHSWYLYQLNDTYGNSNTYYSSEENDTLPFSIEDSSLNNKYFKEISEYCNQRIKETVTLDLITSVNNGISEYKHIIDFRDKIILAGCEYYLVSNNVSISPKELKQSLVLVRWK